MNEHWSKTEIIPCRIQKAAKTEAYDCHAVHPIRERRPEPAAAHMDPEYASCQKLASKTVSLDADLLMKMVRGRMRREVSILRIETCLSILCCVEEQPSSKRLRSTRGEVTGRAHRDALIRHRASCVQAELAPCSTHLGPHCGITPESGRALSHDRCQLFYLACRLLDKGNAGLLAVHARGSREHVIRVTHVHMACVQWAGACSGSVHGSVPALCQPVLCIREDLLWRLSIP